jgi:hypothetical protein
VRHWLSRLGAAVLIALAVAACGSFFPTPPGSPAFDEEIQVVNDTKLAVTIGVNGANLGVVPAHQATTIPSSALPAKPWSVEARSPSGRVLLAFTVPPGEVTSTTTPDGVTTTTGAGSRADLSCGRLDVTVGGPMMGPVHAPDAGAPGDCDP